MKSSAISYKQSLSSSKRGRMYSMQLFMMSKRIFLIMIVIIKKGENVNNAGFDDAEKNSLDNDFHHKQGGEYECMNT